MKQRILSCLLLLSMILSALFLSVSCGGQDEEDQPTSRGGLTLNVYNWGEYISDGFEGSYNTNKEFEKYYYEKTGKKVTVNYSTYATNEDMYAKLKSGAGNYDIVIPSDYMIQKMAEEGMLYAFNPAETVENYRYINEDFRGKYYDPEEKYTVAYSYGMIGVIYNTTLVDEEDAARRSWDLLWDEKYRGKILQFNNPRDGFGTAQYLLGIDINSVDKADWDRALQKLIEQKPLIQAYVSDEIFNKMTGGSAAIGAYYAGDYITMVEDNDALAFYYPVEGTNVFVDAMCIPANAQNKELAIEYINFMLSEDAAVANAEYIGYASPNSLVYNSETYREDMGEDAMDILYGTEGANDNYRFADGTPIDPYYHSFTPEIQDYVNVLWESLKTENSVEAWVHIVTAAIVVLVAALGITTAVQKKKRMRDYYRHIEAAEAAGAGNATPPTNAADGQDKADGTPPTK